MLRCFPCMVEECETCFEIVDQEKMSFTQLGRVLSTCMSVLISERSRSGRCSDTQVFSLHGRGV